MEIKTIDFDARPREHTLNHSSKGDQPKWLYRGAWYKADYMGYEALAEVVISELLKKSNIDAFVKYEPVMIRYDNKTVPGCLSRNFRKAKQQLIPIERLHRIYFGKGLSAAIASMETAGERLQYTAEFIERVTKLKNVGTYFSALAELDAFFLNEDRHTNNIALIRDEETLEFRLCPIFDNGLALLSDLNDYPLDADIYKCISKVKAKPFDEDFSRQAEAAEILYGSPLKFTFSKTDVHSAVFALEGMYGSSICGRVEKIIYEQMRKYPIYFA